MKEIVGILEGLGCQKVKTYIQSGNAVFVSAEKDRLRLSKAIRAGVKKHRGFEPSVMLLELEDLERAIRNNPFPEAETDPRLCTQVFLHRRRSIPI